MATLVFPPAVWSDTQRIGKWQCWVCRSGPHTSAPCQSLFCRCSPSRQERCHGQICPRKKSVNSAPWPFDICTKAIIHLTAMIISQERWNPDPHLHANNLKTEQKSPPCHSLNLTPLKHPFFLIYLDIKLAENLPTPQYRSPSKKCAWHVDSHAYLMCSSLFDTILLTTRHWNKNLPSDIWMA